MTMARNRAFTAGANALAVTDWKAASSRTHLKVHAFDCNNLKSNNVKNRFAKGNRLNKSLN